MSADPFPDLSRPWVVTSYTGRMQRRFRAIFGPHHGTLGLRRAWWAADQRCLLEDLRDRLLRSSFTDWREADRLSLAVRIGRSLAATDRP